MYDITNIKNYILFLKNQCGLSVTLHPIGEESLIFSGDLITFNIHDNPYCVYVKSFPAAQQHCISRQHKILEKCKDGAFCGCCFAGCYEFVYPIFDGHKTVGFISVSGYRCTNSDSYISAAAEKYCIPLGPLKEAYKALKAEEGWTEYFDDTACASYARNGAWFASYDTPRSIVAKGAYIRKHGLQGIMCWEYGSDEQGELLAAMHAGVNESI